MQSFLNIKLLLIVYLFLTPFSEMCWLLEIGSGGNIYIMEISKKS